MRRVSLVLVGLLVGLALASATSNAASTLAAYYQRVYSSGTKLDGRQGLNFVGATVDNTTLAGATTVTITPGLTASSTNTLTNKSISGATNTFSAIPESAITSLTTDLAAKAPLASPTFTGTSSFASGCSLLSDSSIVANTCRITGLTAYTWISTSDGTGMLLGGGNVGIKPDGTTNLQWNFSGGNFYPQGNGTQDVGISGNAPRRLRLAGTAPTSTSFVFSSGWGTTCASTPATCLSGISGSDSNLTFIVTSTGTGQAAAATITYTFKDGTFTSAPDGCRVDLQSASTASELTSLHFGVTSTSATTAVITVQPNAPVVAHTYTLLLSCVGK